MPIRYLLSHRPPQGVWHLLYRQSRTAPARCTSLLLKRNVKGIVYFSTDSVAGSLKGQPRQEAHRQPLLSWGHANRELSTAQNLPGHPASVWDRPQQCAAAPQRGAPRALQPYCRTFEALAQFPRQDEGRRHCAALEQQVGAEPHVLLALTAAGPGCHARGVCLPSPPTSSGCSTLRAWGEER